MDQQENNYRRARQTSAQQANNAATYSRDGYATSQRRAPQPRTSRSSRRTTPKSSLPPWAPLVAAVVVIALLVFIVTRFVSCESTQESSNQANNASQAATLTAQDTQASANQAESAQNTQAQLADLDWDTIQANLETVVPEETAQTLAEKGHTDEDVAWICQNYEELALDGPEVQLKLLKLAAADPTAVHYVRHFAEEYPHDEGTGFTETFTAGTVPRMYQWDERWGYTIYSSTAFGLTGCGPTAFAMVYAGLTGNNDMTPYDFSIMARENGYEATYTGTNSGFYEFASAQYGFSCQTISITEDALADALDSGHVVICNAGYGTFSSYGGHFFVITKLNGDGTLSINDPYSEVRSDTDWDVDLVLSQTKALYSFGL